MKFSRASGILLHPTSLSGEFAIGDLGPSAYEFADFLQSAGQSLWQVLPLGPTGYGGSPYACYSAFAGNILLISPQRLAEQGLLDAQVLSRCPTFNSDKVDFHAVDRYKHELLHEAFLAYRRQENLNLGSAFQEFCRQNEFWLEDYALFRALKDEHGGAAWNEWGSGLAARKSDVLESARQRLSEQIEAERFYQFLFFEQWLALKSYCNQRGIKLIGDIPIFVAYDSVDVWTNREQFTLNEDSTPAVVAGVPPDYFSETGQLWGNPLYNWERMRSDGFAWWIRRVRASLKILDAIRIDHFRGFAACWEIPAGDQTAEHGRWVESPGRELFAAINETLGDVPIIAEDLGVITPDVNALRDQFNFPGMRVLQFAFGSDSSNIDLPHNYSQNVVAYTGTHDNNTTSGWFHTPAGSTSTRTAEEIERERNFCLEYLNTDGRTIHWDFIRAVLASVANTAIVPMQDVLGLGSEARMNLPNTTEGNWMWRLKPDALTAELAAKLQKLTELYGRIPESEDAEARLDN